MIIHDCEQGSDEWLSLRAGIPTGSEFSNLITSTGKLSSSMNDYAMFLAAEKFAGKPLGEFSGNNDTRRGQELEPEARADYAFTYGRQIEEVGFITDDLCRYGVSPDGMVEEDGLAEIKCLKTKNHVKAIVHYNKYGTPPSGYYPQSQGQLLVTGRKWCDMVFYHPDLPMVVARVLPDYKYIQVLKAQLKAVEAKRNLFLNEIKKSS